jgi:hypothetical protein
MGKMAATSTEPKREHVCMGGAMSDAPTQWAYDGQGIPLCRVCPKCRHAKLARYRPEILLGYTQADVDEPIDECD